MRQGVGLGKDSRSRRAWHLCVMLRAMDTGGGTRFDPIPRNTVCATEPMQHEIQSHTLGGKDHGRNS
jgi:hypothetical protein